MAVRIKDCIDNNDAYVAQMATLPDKELTKKLDLVHIQMQMAEQKNNTISLELLEIWHHQIIEARILKAENNIPDALNEIELAIVEERQDTFTENTSYKTHKPNIKEDKDQMSLF